MKQAAFSVWASKKSAWFIVLAATLATLTVAHAQALGGSVGGRPANPDPHNPRTKSIFTYTLNKGQAKNDAVIVSNAGTQTTTVNLYGVDGLTTNTGSYSCKQDSEPRTGVGSWIHLSSSEVTLAAGQQQTVGFTVQIPTVADIGEHDGCIVLQAKDSDTQQTGNVTLHFRSAIRLAVTIPGVIVKQLSFDGLSVTKTPHGQTYGISVSDTGNASVDACVNITLNDLLNHNAYKNGGTYPVLPNSKLSLQYQNTKLPFWGGFFWITGDACYNAQPYAYGVSPGGKGYTTIHTKRQLIFIWPRPIALFIIVAVCTVLVVIVGRFWHQKKKRDAIHKHWDAYVVEHDDTLQTIARIHHTSWKKLAHMNRLKAPYVITKGQKLYVPKAKK